MRKRRRHRRSPLKEPVLNCTTAEKIPAIIGRAVKITGITGRLTMYRPWFLVKKVVYALLCGRFVSIFCPASRLRRRRETRALPVTATAHHKRFRARSRFVPWYSLGAAGVSNLVPPVKKGRRLSIPPDRTADPFASARIKRHPRERDQGFESCLLRRRVRREYD